MPTQLLRRRKAKFAVPPKPWVNNVLHLYTAPQPELAPIEMGHLLDWAYDFLLPLAKQARVEMQIINGLRGVVIEAGRHRLEQVLLNLALNAFRFMPGGGWLSLRGIDCGAEGVQIVVRDTGPGILPEDVPRILMLDSVLVPGVPDWGWPCAGAFWNSMAGQLQSTAGRAMGPHSGFVCRARGRKCPWLVW